MRLDAELLQIATIMTGHTKIPPRAFPDTVKEPSFWTFHALGIVFQTSSDVLVVRSFKTTKLSLSAYSNSIHHDLPVKKESPNMTIT